MCPRTPGGRWVSSTMAAVDKLWAWNSPPKNWLVAVDRNAATHLDAVQRVIDFLRRQSLDVFVPETVEGLTHLSNVSVSYGFVRMIYFKRPQILILFRISSSAVC